ncbi:ABC transporter permease [Breznakia pachnodae]|uniref:ABC transport system permease protein n=1 Tax=Breznakia pachnodae TaxID=265178 RepID=A0ABU0E8Q4_9FIRM|nr:ABC transporter permease [Breznakia pachnodae]MDQ0363109.1 putative ABC transport system permease protein [Breznakia pachnodae]
MRILKRAFWNVCKTYKKTVLMLLVISAIMTLIFSGLALQTSSVQATKKAQKSVGAKVDFFPDYNKMMQAEFGDGISDDMHIVDSKFVERLEKSKYVKELDYSLMAFASSNYHNGMTDMFAQSGSDPFAVQTDNIDGAEIKYIVPSIYVKSLDKPENDLDFKSEKNKLVDGVYPADSKEENPVIVSKKFLERNNLEIGQQIEIKGGDVAMAPLNVTIVGTFESIKSDDSNKSQNSMMPEDDLNDYFYSNMATTQKILMAGNSEERSSIQYESINVTLTSADDLDAFLNEFKNDMGDTSLIKLSSEQASLSQTLSAIDSVGNIANTMVLITTVAAVMILGLLILISLRERKYEVGVLLSLGESKLALIVQIVMESILIMAVSIIISIGSSTMVANQIEDYITEQAISETTEESQKEVDLDLDVNILDPSIFGKGVGIGFGIVIISSVLPMILTLKKDPKTLLLGRD